MREKLEVIQKTIDQDNHSNKNDSFKHSFHEKINKKSRTTVS